jgi:geranylgeranylglycerol-phosphate geranylgeranyltransferase
MPEVARLVRAPNLGIAACGVVAGGWIALGAVAFPDALLWAALAAVGLGAAGNVVNDLFDVPADVANRRSDRPLATAAVGTRTALAAAATGAVLGLGSAALAGQRVFALAAAALAVMLVYSPLLKPLPLLGNLAVAAVAALPLALGALAVERPEAGIVPWVLAAAIHLVRELVKDIDDEPGDRVLHRRTLPVLLGPQRAGAVASLAAVAFVPLSLMLPLRAGYGAPYYLFALPAQMAVLIAATQLLFGQTARIALLLKAAMVTGLVALVTGRLA